MKKITVEKNEGIAEVIDRMLAVGDSNITLVIPKGSALAKSASNFRLLKREAGLAEKSVFIESADEAILDLAETNGIEVASEQSARSVSADVSDIVPRSRPAGDEVIKKNGGVKLTVHTESDDEDDEDKDVAEEQQSFLSADRFFKPRPVPARRDEEDDDSDESGSRGSGKAWAWVVGVVIVLGLVFYGVTVLFGRAQVTIDFTQTPWSYQGNVIADQSVTTTTLNPATNVITVPATVFSASKNITQSFLATGPSVGGGMKAQGTITIYNDYSSAPQELIANTRFATPSGQIFRLVKDTTVPGAQVSAGGTITPSSITASIVADQAGPAYDVGPVEKLTIPGFDTNAAKEAGFYGAITGQTTGGTSGSHPTPTAADIAGAKASTTVILQADLQDGLTASYPNNFKILDGATDIQITKLTVNTSTDANGDFSVFGEASLTAIGFDESALQNYLLSLAQSQATSSAGGGTAMAFKNFAEPDYSDVQASFSKGQVSFSLSASEALEPAFSSTQFAASIAGESIGSARDAIQNLPELSNGTISVWPIWLWAMPSNPAKINVTAN